MQPFFEYSPRLDSRIRLNQTDDFQKEAPGDPFTEKKLEHGPGLVFANYTFYDSDTLELELLLERENEHRREEWREIMY